jgi:Cys-tRNA(Pro)/Cys-tRNA(Cys) deacylase
MTPAVRAAEAAGIAFELREYEHDPSVPSYGLEAAQALGLEPATVFKTLVAELDDRRLVVALVPVHRSLDLKALAAALGAKRAAMAPVAAAERATGYVAGGISPLGQRKRLPVVADASLPAQAQVFVSAGRRGLEIGLAPADLIRVCAAAVAPIAREG